jgi:multidrug efflux pump subunit AcrA (membrane-fusion protein)
MDQRSPNQTPNEVSEPKRVINSDEDARVQSNDPATNRSRRILIISTALAVLLILVFVLLVWRWRKTPAEEEKTSPVVSVKVSKAEKGAIATEISAVGTIWPRDKAEVAAKVSAQIKTMALLKNKFVKAGEIIAVLESRDLRAQSAEAAASAAWSPARFPKRMRKTRRPCPTRARKLTMRERFLNAAAYCTKEAASRKKISKRRNWI